MSTPNKFSRYTIIRELGRGGMATLFLAFDPNFDREVAIKVLSRHLTTDPQFLDRFRREAKAIASLEHPAIVPVYDYGEEDDQAFLVMRFMGGGTLLQKIRQAGRLSLDQSIDIYLQIAPALDRAHERGIIHRDLKPANILFDEDNNAYVSDFGIAKLTESTVNYTGSAIIGTPAYMSPEQIKGERVIDSRSDVYSLGAMLYEMLSGEVPYKAETPTKQLMKHVLEPVPRLTVVLPTAPVEIETILMKALAKEPDDRFQTPSSFVEALEAAYKPQKPEPGSGMATIIDTLEDETIYETGSRERPSFPAASPPATPLPATPSPSRETPAPQPRREETAPAAAAGRRRPSGWILLGVAAVVIAALLALSFVQGSGGLAAFGFGSGGEGDGSTAIATGELATASPEPGEGGTGAAGQATAEAAVGESPTPTETPAPPTETPLPPTETPTPLPTETPSPTPTSTIDPSRDLALVPTGPFQMGCAPEDDRCREDELPLHTVTIGGFFIDQYEVTNRQYGACVAAGVCDAPDDFGSATRASYYDNPEFAEFPVIFVSWFDAVTFCEWGGMRLPTEAEWEKAARGGDDTRIYPWGNGNPSCELGNLKVGGADCREDTNQVGSYPAGASPYGAFEMSGNVFEWVSDWYQEDYYAISPEQDPPGPEEGELKSLRGGRWYSFPHIYRISFRGRNETTYSSNYLGFRCAADAQ